MEKEGCYQIAAALCSGNDGSLYNFHAFLHKGLLFVKAKKVPITKRSPPPFSQHPRLKTHNNQQFIIKRCQYSIVHCNHDCHRIMIKAVHYAS